MLKLTLFEFHSGALIQIAATQNAGLPLRFIDCLEIEYPFGEMASLVEFVQFITEYRAEHEVKRSLLPWIFMGKRHISYETCVAKVTAMLEGTIPETALSVRFSSASRFTRRLLESYLLFLEHRAKVVEDEAAESHLLDLRHPLFQPIENSEAHASVVARESSPTRTGGSAPSSTRWTSTSSSCWTA
jgi:hypothetical protein